MTGLSESHPLRRPLSRRRRLAGAISATLVWVAVAVAVIPLLLVMFTVVKKGGSLITPRFLTDDLPIQARSAEGGVGPAVTGTLLITGFASLIAIPVGILAAVYLTEYKARGVLAITVRFIADVMTGIPSIFVGIFVFTAVVLVTHTFSSWAGGLALGILMLPVIVRTTEEAIWLVPGTMREAALALGVRRWRTVVSVVLPTALPGITTGGLDPGNPNPSVMVTEEPATITRSRASSARAKLDRRVTPAAAITAMVASVSAVRRALSQRRGSRSALSRPSAAPAAKRPWTTRRNFSG